MHAEEEALEKYHFKHDHTSDLLHPMYDEVLVLEILIIMVSRLSRNYMAKFSPTSQNLE